MQIAFIGLGHMGAPMAINLHKAGHAVRAFDLSADACAQVKAAGHVDAQVADRALAMIDVVSEAKTPMISMAASARIVEPMDDKKKWVFKTPQNDIMMSLAIVEHMAASGVKTVAFIGFSDAYGEGWYQEWGKAPVALHEGMVITIPPEVKHWHGAKGDSWFSHIAMEVPGENASNEWCEPVSDADYNALEAEK